MIYRKKCEPETVPIEGCMSGKGTVKMEKFLYVPKEMMGKGRAYMRYTLNPSVSIGMHTHEGKMETMAIISGKAVHTVNGQERCPEAGDMTVAQSGDTHGITREGTEPLILTAQVLYV